MIVERVSENVHSVRIGANFNNKEWEQYFLLLSDVHFDNPKCKRKLLFKHLDEAKKLNAPVLINGDLFCLMQGKYDPRSSKSDIRPQHNKADYLDAVINEAATLFAPYGDILTVVGRGNHEQSVLHRQETDVIRRFCLRLSEKCGRTVYPGGYGGYVIVKFEYPKGKASTPSRRSVRIKYFHGSGGGGIVSRGVLKTRMGIYLPDADIVTTGHIHEKWAVNIARERLSEHGNISLSNQLHVCTGTYKEEYGTGKSGWHVETGKPPKALGGYWLRFTSTGGSDNRKVVAQAMEAV